MQTPILNAVTNATAVLRSCRWSLRWQRAARSSRACCGTWAWSRPASARKLPSRYSL